MPALRAAAAAVVVEVYSRRDEGRHDWVRLTFDPDQLERAAAILRELPTNETFESQASTVIIYVTGPSGQRFYYDHARGVLSREQQDVVMTAVVIGFRDLVAY